MTALGALAGGLLTAARAVRGGGVIVNEHTPRRADIRAHVETLARHFDFIHHDELLARMAVPRARPFCLLTFDDGKRSNATEVAPELERLGVPAVFYVVTRFLTENGTLWFDVWRALRDKLGKAPPGLERAEAKSLPFDVLQERLARACREHDVEVVRDDDTAPMTWDQARALAGKGFTIGSHAQRHAILTCEPEDVARAEITASIAEVTAAMGAPCASFAFPNGNYTEVLARHAIAAGVGTVVTTEPLWVDARVPPWRLPRVQLHPHQRADAIALKLAVAATGRWLADPNGTGRAYRTPERTAGRPSA